MSNAERPRRPGYDSPAADRYASSHLNNRTPELNTVLADALQNCRTNKFPDWSAIASQGKFLMLQCRLMDVQHMLEIGTFGAQSAIWCASANDTIKITTIEMDANYAAVARDNIRNAGLEERVELLEGKAQDVVPRLVSDIAAGVRPRFGLVSVDVQTFGDTWELVDKVVGLCQNRACLMVHCAVRPSNLSVRASEEKDPRVRGSRELVEEVGKDQRLDAIVLMTDGEQSYDTLIASVNVEPTGA